MYRYAPRGSGGVSHMGLRRRGFRRPGACGEGAAEHLVIKRGRARQMQCRQLNFSAGPAQLLLSQSYQQRRCCSGHERQRRFWRHGARLELLGWKLGRRSVLHHHAVLHTCAYSGQFWQLSYWCSCCGFTVQSFEFRAKASLPLWLGF